MEEEKNVQGNPETVDDAVFGSESDDFFSALDSDVNGIVQDDEPYNEETATPAMQDPVNQQKAAVSQSSENSTELDNLKKRYSDSSREAQNLKAQLNELQPFMPVLDAMKQDGNLVSHVRNYFEKGGNVPNDIKTNLNLDENFEFDPDEMVKNPESDSRKVFNTMVGDLVDKKANQIVQQQEEKGQAEAYQQQVGAHAKDFMKRNGLTVDEFQNFVGEAQERFSNKGMTFDDMYLIINKGKVNQNVANATKNEMLTQMKNVRNIPTSQSASNNAGNPVSHNDNVFDALLNSDGNIEELLG